MWSVLKTSGKKEEIRYYRRKYSDHEDIGLFFVFFL
jgi:hypothetical protein